MIKRHLTALHTEAPGEESLAASRERLKVSFPPGSIRRMTLPGLMVGHCLAQIGGTEGAALVYASIFGEGLALEAYLDSFPDASPTLFQTSIHPSGPQQGLIARKQPVSNFFPLTGGPFVAGQGLLCALLSPEPHVIFCGADEKGARLADVGATGRVSHAFALSLRNEPAPGTLATIELHRDDAATEGLDLEPFFALFHSRSPYCGPALPGWQLRLTWL